MITQKDIAKSLGISQPAVGAVVGSFSEKSKTVVSPELRDRILRKAEELGYRPNIFAQQMRGRSTGVIGAIHFTSFLQSNVQREIYMAKAVAAAGHKLITADAIATLDSGVDNPSFSLLVDQMIDFRVDGVILSGVVGMMPAEEIARLTKQGIPCVSMSGIPFPGVPFVGADVELGMYVLTQHVIRQGHRNLVMIAQEESGDHRNPNTISISPRMNGYSSAVEAEGGQMIFLNDLSDSRKRKAMQKASQGKGLNGYVFRAPGSMNVEETYAVGYRAVNKLLDVGIPADVVLLPNDDWLQGALLALKERCVAVPEQMGLTGFDASPYGQFGMAPFTTVAQPLKEIAHKAVEILLSMIDGKPAPEQAIVRLPCSLVSGTTTTTRLP